MEMALHGWQQLAKSLSEKEVEAWGAVQHSLGLAYQDRVVGDGADNNREAIRHFNESLAVYDRTRFPGQWAKTHHKLAISLLALERAEASGALIGHLDEQRRLGLVSFALSTVSSSEASSAGAAGAKGGSAARGPGAGAEGAERAQTRASRENSGNVDAAIVHLELALQVYAAQQSADTLWRVNLDLAAAYLLLSAPFCATNLDKAIAHFEATLRAPGFSRELQTQQWAGVHEAVAAAILLRAPTSEEQRVTNLDKAIAHYLALLDVQRALGASEAWAATQRAIGDAWLAMMPAPARTALAADRYISRLMISRRSI
jgi:tetratricopeptide (TPR) repeat protein